MSRTIVLDAGPLGLVTNPKQSPQSLACAQWLQALVASGARVIVPEISDYEVRRELLRTQKLKGIERLDALAGLLHYLPAHGDRCQLLIRGFDSSWLYQPNPLNSDIYL